MGLSYYAPAEVGHNKIIVVLTPAEGGREWVISYFFQQLVLKTTFLSPTYGKT